MARINSYPRDLAIGGSEILLGSDSDGSTKTFDFLSIRDFMVKNGVSGTVIFQAETNQSDFTSGKITASGALTSVQSLKISKTNVAGFDVTKSLEELVVGKRIKLISIPYVGQFQRYRVTSVASDSDSFTLGLVSISGSSSTFTDEQFYTLELLEDDLNFNVSVSSNGSEWSQSGDEYILTIAHNLYKHATIDVFDSGGSNVVGAVSNNTLRNIQVRFKNQFACTVFIN
tara:strand:- start:8 stop:694 length:687 start_codon:yes stop_codon:yes gene_type:complete